MCASASEAVDSFALPRSSALIISPQFVFETVVRRLARCLIQDFCLEAVFPLDAVRPRLHRAASSAWSAVYCKGPLSVAAD